MFERYTEKARRVIFFARYEASQYGSPLIEAEFLLLGLIREDAALSRRFLASIGAAEAIRREIELQHPSREKIPTSVDLPLSHESKRALANAAEEAERLQHHSIGSEHLLLGILREENSFAGQLLKRHGIEAQVIREDIAKNPQPDHGVHTSRTPSPGFFQLALKVANLEASVDFYKKLGFTVVGIRGTGTAVLTNGTCNLRLDRNLATNHILAFHTGDIASTVSRIQSAGLEIEQGPEPKAFGSAAALLHDPDGNLIALHSRSPIPPLVPPR